MKKEEIKKYAAVNNDSLERTVGGHRHHRDRYYDAGRDVGRVVSIAGAVAGIASLFLFTKNNK